MESRNLEPGDNPDIYLFHRPAWERVADELGSEIIDGQCSVSGCFIEVYDRVQDMDARGVELTLLGICYARVVE
jgi:hypothetical protein